MTQNPDSEELINKQRAEIERLGTPHITTTKEWHFLTGQCGNNSGRTKKYPYHKANLRPVKDNQVLLADIYVSWCGPCTAVETHLKRLRMSSIEKPEALYLAKVCCDDIPDLKVFKDDPRPTFLFWARGRPVAMLRGINRPLLTKLVLQEVNMEIHGLERDTNKKIDLSSDTAIQCQGSLADLATDEFTHSIGCGKTDKLSTLFQEGLLSISSNEKEFLQVEVKEEMKKEELSNSEQSEINEELNETIETTQTEENPSKEEVEEDITILEDKDENLDCNALQSPDESDVIKKPVKKSKLKFRNRKKVLNKSNGSNGLILSLEPGVLLDDDEEEEESDEISKNLNGTINIQSENGFQKVRKKKKKMETALLKEILNTKVLNKRHY